MYLVTYAKVTLDKQSGIQLQGIYFGGTAPSEDEAAQVAKSCVSNNKGGTVLPKVLPLEHYESFIDALYESTQRFEELVGRMKEADQILSRPR